MLLSRTYFGAQSVSSQVSNTGDLPIFSKCPVISYTPAKLPESESSYSCKLCIWRTRHDRLNSKRGLDFWTSPWFINFHTRRIYANKIGTRDCNVPNDLRQSYKVNPRSKYFGFSKERLRRRVPEGIQSNVTRFFSICASWKKCYPLKIGSSKKRALLQIIIQTRGGNFRSGWQVTVSILRLAGAEAPPPAFGFMLKLRPCDCIPLVYCWERFLAPECPRSKRSHPYTLKDFDHIPWNTSF
jgi:hypothetical protein